MQTSPQCPSGSGCKSAKINSIGPQSIDSVHFNNYQLGLNVSWEIDLWGKLRDQGSAAIAQTEAGAAELLQVKQSLAAQIAKAGSTIPAHRPNGNWPKKPQIPTNKIKKPWRHASSVALPMASTYIAFAQTASSHAQIETAQRSLDAVHDVWKPYSVATPPLP